MLLRWSVSICDAVCNPKERKQKKNNNKQREQKKEEEGFVSKQKWLQVNVGYLNVVTFSFCLTLRFLTWGHCDPHLNFLSRTLLCHAGWPSCPKESIPAEVCVLTKSLFLIHIKIMFWVL